MDRRSRSRAPSKEVRIDSKEIILRKHLYPALGDLPLDKITTEKIARLSAGLARYSRKTLGNILATLAKLLRTAVDWDVLRVMPCKIKIPKATRTPPTFYEQDVMRRLIDAGKEIDARTHALMLVGLAWRPPAGGDPRTRLGGHQPGTASSWFGATRSPSTSTRPSPATGASSISRPSWPMRSRRTG